MALAGAALAAISGLLLGKDLLDVTLTGPRAKRREERLELETLGGEEELLAQLEAELAGERQFGRDLGKSQRVADLGGLLGGPDPLAEVGARQQLESLLREDELRMMSRLSVVQPLSVAQVITSGGGF